MSDSIPKGYYDSPLDSIGLRVAFDKVSNLEQHFIYFTLDTNQILKLELLDHTHVKYIILQFCALHQSFYSLSDFF